MLGKKMFGRKSDFIFILLMILFCSLSMFPGEGEAVEQWRVVLKWTGQPHDLDAHLLVPQASPNDVAPFHISWEQRGTTQVYPYAVLENDSIQEGGSETIVISRLLAGTYKFAVQNFSMEKALAGRQAVVEVFRGSQRLAVYQLEQAAGGKGRWWHVFKIQDGELVSLNVIDEVPIEKDPRVENIPSFRLQPSEMPADASLPFRISFDLTGTGITLNSEAADLVFKFPAERQVIVLRAVRQGENRYAADLPVALEKEEYIVDLYPAGNHEGIPRGRSTFTVIPANEVPAGPVINQVVVMPFQAEVEAGGTINFYIKLYDERGDEIQLQVQPVWTADKGTIDSSGRYTAPAEPGEATVRATVHAFTAGQKMQEVSGKAVVKIIPSKETFPRLSLFPATSSVSEGAYRDVSVEVSPVNGLQGCDLILQFDPQVLRVVAVKPGELRETVAQAVYDNEAGRISFAAANGTPGDYPAGATLLTVTFAGKSRGQSTVAFVHHKLAGKDGVLLEHEASGEGSLLRVEPAGDAKGQLQLGPGVNLKRLAAKFKVLLADQPVAFTLNEDGSFKVYGLPEGSHDLVFWCPGFLKKKVSVEVSGGAEAYLPDGVELYAGDLNADNEVNLSDLVRLASSFWSSAGEERYLEIADFNRDGQVGLSDLIMMARSYRLKGDE